MCIRDRYDTYGQIQHERLDFKYLSMGMSGDFQVAIEEGSNLIRVGTSISVSYTHLDVYKRQLL